MSLTKEKIAAIVIAFGQGGKIASYRRVTPRDVYERIEIVRNGAMEASIKENGDLGGEFVTQYLGPDGNGVDVVCDPITLQKYSILPSRLISFGDYSGLRQVSPMKNQKESFIILPNGFLSTFKSLEAAELHGNVGCYIERVKIGTDQSIRIYYVNIPDDYEKVLVKQIASVYDFDENEALPIPAEFEETLLNKVGQYFFPQFQIPQEVREGLTPETQKQ